MKNKLIAKLHILLSQKGINKDSKADIYSQYGVTTSKEMTLEQLSDLINRLDGKRVYNSAPVPVAVDVKALRSEVLLVLTGSPSAKSNSRRGLGIPNDWDYLNSFISHHGGKNLVQMTLGELKSFKKKLLAIRQSGWVYRPRTEPQPQQSVKTVVTGFISTHITS